jgi:hypothetical protein
MGFLIPIVLVASSFSELRLLLCSGEYILVACLPVIFTLSDNWDKDSVRPPSLQTKKRENLEPFWT